MLGSRPQTQTCPVLTPGALGIVSCSGTLRLQAGPVPGGTECRSDQLLKTRDFRTARLNAVPLLSVSSEAQRRQTMKSPLRPLAGNALRVRPKPQLLARLINHLAGRAACRPGAGLRAVEWRCPRMRVTPGKVLTRGPPQRPGPSQRPGVWPQGLGRAAPPAVREPGDRSSEQCPCDLGSLRRQWGPAVPVTPCRSPCPLPGH